MKKILLGLLLILSLVTLYASPVIGQGEHHEMMDDMCHDATESVVVATDDTEIAFNATEFQVSKGACVQFHFVNTQDAEHDFAVYFANGTEYFGLHMKQAGMMMLKAPVPNEDTVLEFWCTVEDHKEQGMRGVIIVGEGEKKGLPGFDFFTAFFSLSLLFIAISRKRKL